MKPKKILITLLALALGASVLAGCGDSSKPLGTKEKGDRTEITFVCDENRTSKAAWDALVTAYNDGAGYETDKVYVTKKAVSGVSSSTASSYFTSSEKYAANVIAVSDNQNTLQKLVIERDTSRAPDGYFVNLTPYAEKDEDFKKNTINPELMDWWRITYNKDAKQGAGQPKHVIGAGQNLMGVPYGTPAHFNWYNKSLFEAQGVNIISCEEERLATAYPGVMPHGYAEYKTAPFEGAKSSKNLAGDTVYKVFNNRIGMNWEEQRVFLKYFTKSYNTPSTSTYGFVSEYWFNYGWSVGGDVMGFDGEEYDFTLMDDSKNYLVVKDGVKVNGADYARGSIVRYEDRVNANNIDALVSDGSLYAIESQYNAIKEYVSLQVSSATTVDVKNNVTYKGYGVATPDTSGAINLFTTEQVAMNRGLFTNMDQILKSSNASKFDMCPAETYREYEGGSTYYKGDATFANEHMRVIGETYDDLKTTDNPTGLYTGALKKVNDTPVVGNSTTAGITQGLVIPACSDPAKYQAAWDFISWVATEGQKYIAQTDNLAPVAYDTLFGADFADNAELNKGRNYYALAMASYNVGRGDWGYFESGTWVTNWSNDFNGKVRKGSMTLSDFNTNKAAAAKSALDNMYCVIKGIR